MAWTQGVKGLLLDVTGVLYNSGSNGGTAINGSKEAIDKLREDGIPFKLCSNESSETRAKFASKLQKHGFAVSKDDIVCPPPVMASILQKENLRPHLLVHPDMRIDFIPFFLWFNQRMKILPGTLWLPSNSRAPSYQENVVDEFSALDKSDPNCVVIGDCMETFTYDTMNEAFRVLLGLKEKKLFSLGTGAYYKQGGELVLDVGSYAAALEFACDCKRVVCGKPEPAFFNQALEEIGVAASECAMVGDDIVHDVGGAQKLGMRGIQVRTGKYRPCDEPHAVVKPDAYVNDLADAVNQLLVSRTN